MTLLYTLLPHLNGYDTIAVIEIKMNNKYKEWIKIILLPHLITAIFLGPAIIVFWSGGFIGLYSVINVFSELGSLKYYIYIGIPLIFIMFLLGFYWKNLTIGKILTSSCDIFMVSLRFFMPRVADINLLK